MRAFQTGIIRAAAAAFLFLLLYFSAARSETAVTFTPARPRAGDCVDVTVTTDRKDAKGVIYRLSLDGKREYYGRTPVKRFTASFRPRKEGVYTLEVIVSLGRQKTETVTVSIPVSGAAPEERGPSVIYSQMDGWWRGKDYARTHRRTLESSGCAVFALSHALQRLGFDSDETLPDRLALDYEKYYIEGVGTSTEALITQAGLHFGFQTVHRLVRSEEEILSFLERGDLFCIGIVKGHVALADGVDPESRKVHIVDSAPDITFSKLKNAPVYLLSEDGTWQTISSAEELPGVRWFFETSHVSGAGYWLDLSDCAARGLRLIRRPWLTLHTGSGEASVSAEWFGTVRSAVRKNGQTVTVRTAGLNWLCAGADRPQLAVVTRERGASFTHRNGDEISGFRPIPWGRVLGVLQADNERVYVFWRGTFGYLKREDVILTDIPEEDLPAAVITVKGKPAGTTVRGFRQADEKSAAAAEWPSGTEVAILERQNGFCLAEGLGCRGWIPEKYLSEE